MLWGVADTLCFLKRGATTFLFSENLPQIRIVTVLAVDSVRRDECFMCGTEDDAERRQDAGSSVAGLAVDLHLWLESLPLAEPALAAARKLAHTCQPAFTHKDQVVQGTDRRQMAWPWDLLSFQIVLSHGHVYLSPERPFSASFCVPLMSGAPSSGPCVSSGLDRFLLASA